MSSALMRKLKQAEERLHGNDVAGAQFLCAEILRRAPRNPDALYLLAVTHLMTARAGDAIPLLEQLLTVEPRHGAARENLGVAYLMAGQFAHAERTLRAAADLPGAPASVFMRLGAALINQQRYAEAVQELQRALERAPADPDTHLNLGQAKAQIGDTSAAERHFDAVLRAAPGHVEAMFNLGVLELGRDRLDAARQWFERVVARAPTYADAHVNLGIVLQREQRLEASLACFERALELSPMLASAHSNLAQTLALQGKLEAARDRYLAALRIAPALVAAHEGLAAACLPLGRFKEGIFHLREVLRAEPGNEKAASALAQALFEDGQLDDAMSAAERARALDHKAAAPYSVVASVHYVRGEFDRMIEVLEAGYAATGDNNLLGMLTYELRRVCAWDKWVAAWQRLAAALAGGADDAGSPFALLCEPLTALQQLEYTRRWAGARWSSVGALSSAPARTRTARPRLRVGYLSSDLHQHAVAYLVTEVLELHDRERFEIFAYSYGPEDHSPTRARLRAACEHFVDIARDPDDVATQRIRSDELDILVDLKGYTLGARAEILARRPCPVQINWLGYPGTMGTEFIDYLIADAFLVPDGAEGAYSERVLRMAHCYQPNDRQRVISTPRTRAEYGLPATAFVFCCFNQTSKITPEIFACWMDLLRALPRGVLWLLEDNRWASANLSHAARAHGIAPERVIFAPRMPLQEHLARYRVADLALDTHPYTSHTTASDALWSDCPLVALCGDTFAARVSGSILTYGGLPELVTWSLRDYATLSHRVATDDRYRNALRQKLVASKPQSPLFDSPAFARNLERLYLDIKPR